MAVSLVQLVGFTPPAMGLFLISASTAMDMWSVEGQSFNAATNVHTYSGLWRSCVGTSYGSTQCRPDLNILGPPALLQAVRALMIIAIVLGAIGLLVAILALKCLKMGNLEDRIKATMTLVAEILFLLAGVGGIAGVSAFANLIVQSFRFTAYADNGLLTGGMSVGGLTGSLSPRYDGMAYKAATQQTTYNSDTRTRTAYNDSCKAQSVDATSQRFDYV